MIPPPTANYPRFACSQPTQTEWIYDLLATGKITSPAGGDAILKFKKEEKGGKNAI